MENPLKNYFFSKKNLNSLLIKLKDYVSKDSNLNKYPFPDLEHHFLKICELSYNQNLNVTELKIINSLSFNNMLELIYQYQQQKEAEEKEKEEIEVEKVLKEIYAEGEVKGDFGEVEVKQKEERLLVPLNHNKKSLSKVKKLTIEKILMCPVPTIYETNSCFSFLLDDVKHDVNINPGFYINPHTIITKLKEQLLKISPCFRISLEDNFISLIHSKEWTLIYSPFLEILGFNNIQYESCKLFKAQRTFYILEPRYYLSCKDLDNIKDISTNNTYCSIFDSTFKATFEFKEPKDILLNFDLFIRKNGQPVSFYTQEFPHLLLTVEY